MIEAPFPEKLNILFRPSRYKVLYGGRGAGRSWGCARAALLMGADQIEGVQFQAPLRVLCAREFQNSIADSVHKLIADQITDLGMNYLYDVQKERIVGREATKAVGTELRFEGIKNNVNRIRSFEGVQLVWVEEAVKVSRQSWGVLIPTIRREGSEIWMSFNPELETDYTYVRFVLEAEPPPTMHVVKMTWRDNPWFPEVLRKEMERDKARDEDYYLNVWEGHCIQALEGAIYAKELRRCQEDGRIGKVPWDPEYPVETAWDLGRADATAIWFFQRIALQIRFIDYCTASGEDLSFFLEALQGRGYHYSRHHLPHDAGAKRLGSRKTIQEILDQHYHGTTLPLVTRHSLSDGINAARLLLKRCWFDERKCADGLTALRHYQYRVVEGQRQNEPLHDWASDGADAFRYAAFASLSSPRVVDPKEVEERLLNRRSLSDAVGGAGRRLSSALGWMSH